MAGVKRDTARSVENSGIYEHGRVKSRCKGYGQRFAVSMAGQKSGFWRLVAVGTILAVQVVSARCLLHLSGVERKGTSLAPAPLHLHQHLRLSNTCSSS
jgi:hypothetical protein